MNYGYLVVEGPHDIEFVGCLLKKVHKLKRIVKNNELDPYWNLIIPKTFPPDGDLRKRMPVPAFFQNDNLQLFDPTWKEYDFDCWHKRRKTLQVPQVY